MMLVRPQGLLAVSVLPPPTPCSFSSRGYYLDGSAIFGSLVLLVLLLALTFERILGLDRFVNQALQ